MGRMLGIKATVVKFGVILWCRCGLIVWCNSMVQIWCNSLVQMWCHSLVQGWCNSMVQIWCHSMVQGGKREIYTAVGVIQHPDKGAENQKQMRLNPMEYNTYVYDQSLSLLLSKLHDMRNMVSVPVIFDRIAEITIVNIWAPAIADQGPWRYFADEPISL